jgi:hypothetical protein
MNTPLIKRPSYPYIHLTQVPHSISNPQQKKNIPFFVNESEPTRRKTNTVGRIRTCELPYIFATLVHTQLPRVQRLLGCDSHYTTTVFLCRRDRFWEEYEG